MLYDAATGRTETTASFANVQEFQSQLPQKDLQRGMVLQASRVYTKPVKSMHAATLARATLRLELVLKVAKGSLLCA